MTTNQMVYIVECIKLVDTFFKNDSNKTAAWMKAKNPLLGESSPIMLILRGRGHKVLAFIKSQLDENKPEEPIKPSVENE